MSIDNKIIERQAQATNARVWEGGNSSKLFNGSDSTFLRAYWRWNVPSSLQDILVLFQDEDPNYSIIQGRFESYQKGNSSWVANRLGLLPDKGSTFAMCPVEAEEDGHLMLYTVDQNKILQQHEYYVDNTNLSSGDIVSSSCKYLTTSHNL